MRQGVAWVGGTPGCVYVSMPVWVWVYISGSHTHINARTHTHTHTHTPGAAGRASSEREAAGDVGGLVKRVLGLPAAVRGDVVAELVDAVCALVESNAVAMRADSWGWGRVEGGEGGTGAEAEGGKLIEGVLGFLDIALGSGGEAVEGRERVHSRVLDALMALLLLRGPLLRLQHYKEALRLVALVGERSSDAGVSQRAVDHLYAVHLVLTKKAWAAAKAAPLSAGRGGGDGGVGVDGGGTGAVSGGGHCNGVAETPDTEAADGERRSLDDVGSCNGAAEAPDGAVAAYNEGRSRGAVAQGAPDKSTPDCLLAEDGVDGTPPKSLFGSLFAWGGRGGEDGRCDTRAAAGSSPSSAVQHPGESCDANVTGHNAGTAGTAGAACGVGHGPHGDSPGTAPPSDGCTGNGSLSAGPAGGGGVEREACTQGRVGGWEDGEEEGGRLWQHWALLLSSLCHVVGGVTVCNCLLHTHRHWCPLWACISPCMNMFTRVFANTHLRAHI